MHGFPTQEEKIAFVRGLISGAGKLKEGFRGISASAAKKGLKPTEGKSVDDIYKAYRQKAIKDPEDPSLIMWPARVLAEKVMGKKNVEKVRGGLFDYFHTPSMAVDTAVGRGLQKIPLAKSLFTVKEKIPVGKGVEQTVERASALAPLSKARDIAEPFLLGAGIEKGISGIKDMRQQAQQAQMAAGGAPPMLNKPLREKVASVMLKLHEENKEHEKRGQALKLLYKQASLGYTEFPQTYSELETKLAELVKEDLVVLDKALELAGGDVKLGELTNKDPKDAVKPEEKFQASVLGEEF